MTTRLENPTPHRQTRQSHQNMIKSLMDSRTLRHLEWLASHIISHLASTTNQTTHTPPFLAPHVSQPPHAQAARLPDFSSQQSATRRMGTGAQEAHACCLLDLNSSTKTLPSFPTIDQQATQVYSIIPLPPVQGHISHEGPATKTTTWNSASCGKNAPTNSSPHI